MRPEYVKCIRVVHEHAKEWTWCHRRAEGFVLVDIDHGALLSVAGSRLLVCSECSEAVAKALSDEPPDWLVELARGARAT